MDVRRMKPKQKPKVDMNRRIKPNPKYQNVQPVTDTGNNTRKQLEKMEELRQFYKFRPDEIFRRVTVSSLVGLMLEVSKLEYQEEDEAASSRKTSTIDDFESHNDLNSTNGEEHEEGNSSDPGCDNDSLDGGDRQQQNGEGEEQSEEKPEEKPEEQADPAPLAPADNGDMFESVVFKGRMMKRTLSTHSQLHSSLGDLLSGTSEMSIHRPHNQLVHASRAYHHQNSWNAASSFNYDDSASSVGGRSEPARIQQAPLPAALPPPPPRREALYVEEPAPPVICDRPFLLLDIRQPEDFERSHIIMSRNYPTTRLTRAVNFETREMLHYKNKEGKLIIVYDYDESISHKFATTLVQRGYDNVFMLSGGIRVTQIKFPNCLIRKGERKPTDPEERLSEEEVHILEAFLEEAHASGAGRMSSLSSIRLQSRLQSSLSNLPVIVGGGSQAGVPHSKRGLMHSPVRASLRSLSIGRS